MRSPWANPTDKRPDEMLPGEHGVTLHGDGTITDRLGNFVGIDQPAAARCVVCDDRGCEFCPDAGLVEFVTPDDEFSHGLGEVDGQDVT